MKNFGICMALLFLLFGSVGGFFLIRHITESTRINNIKKGWYVEVTYDTPINIRDIPSTKGESLGTVKKGEIYKVLDINLENKYYYWYKIEFKGGKGWIASGRTNYWVKDVNNPNDIAVPEIRFTDSVYKVSNINNINYKHLEIIEDSDDYTITHEIYHEVEPAMYIDQYWIKYTITDKAGKTSSKLQKIEFDEKPDDSQVLDFSELKR